MVAMGILDRVLRYLAGHPLWPDESFLAASYLNRGYLEMFQPLEYSQVAPLLYLWIQLTLVKLLGFHVYALRIFSLGCGIGSLLLFRQVARRLLTGAAQVFAVGVFASTLVLIRYSAEAKPYGSDLLASMILVWLAVRCYQSPAPRRWLWSLAAAAPVLMLLSYPAAYVGGGVSLALAVVAWQRRSKWTWCAWGTFNLALVGGFAVVLMISAAQAQDVEGIMEQVWDHAFPPRDSLVSLGQWLLEELTSDMLAYPAGGSHYASSLTFVWCVVGVWALWSRRQWTLLLLCLTPLSLNLVAAFLHKYPFGGHIRFSLFSAPLICLLVGTGAVTLLQWISRSPVWQQRCLRACVVAFVLMGWGRAVLDIVKPYKTPEYCRARDFARWFWHDYATTGELVCLKTDLGLDFGATDYTQGKSSLYLCNQRIYSARHAAGLPPNWDQVSSDWPLRCVFYKEVDRFDHAAFNAWLRKMQTRYQLVSTTRLPEGRWNSKEEYRGDTIIEVYEFVPRNAAVVAEQPTATPR